MNSGIVLPIVARLQWVMSYLLAAQGLAMENIAKLTALQLSILHAYVDLAVDNLRVAARVNDLKGLRAYLVRQAALVGVVADKMALDAQAFRRLAIEFGVAARKAFT